MIMIWAPIDAFSCDALAALGEHVLAEVDAAVACRFAATAAASEGKPFAGEDAGEAVFEAFVLSEEIADFAGAHSDVTGGNVGVFADVAVQLGHE